MRGHSARTYRHDREIARYYLAEKLLALDSREKKKKNKHFKKKSQINFTTKSHFGPFLPSIWEKKKKSSQTIYLSILWLFHIRCILTNYRL